jgi:hypothetical protein
MSAIFFSSIEAQDNVTSGSLSGYCAVNQKRLETEEI